MQVRKAFTLIELVVVVMIIGILVAIAAPKMLNITGEATDNSARMSLEVIRDAIETHASQNGGAYPTGTSDEVKTALKPYIRGVFPTSLVGNKNADVAVETADADLVAGGAEGWKYNSTTGEFIINDAAYAAF